MTDEMAAHYYAAGVNVARLATFVTIDMRDILAAHQPLTIGRMRILLLLRSGARQLTEIAELERIQLPTASTKVSRMAKEGLVTRRQHSSDRRAKLIELTPLGRQMMRRGVEAIDAFLDNRLRTLTADEIKEVAPLLVRLTDAFQGENVALTNTATEVPESVDRPLGRDS